MSTTKTPAQIVAETRKALRMDMREFGKHLGVSAQSVYLYESEQVATDDRLAQWMQSEEFWLSVMAIRVYLVKHWPDLTALVNAKPVVPEVNLSTAVRQAVKQAKSGMRQATDVAVAE